MTQDSERRPPPLHASDAGAQSTEARLLEVVRRLVAETHPGLESRVAPGSELEHDLALDSLARVELLLRLGEAFGVTLPERALAEAATVGDLLHFLGDAAAVAPASMPAVGALLTPREALVVPTQAQTLVEALDWHASQHGDRLHVLLYGEGETTEEITYGALRDGARRVATGLLSRGLQPRQAVALMLPTGREYLASFFGVMIAGGIPVPIYPPARLSQIEEHLRRHGRILANAECVKLITVAQAKTLAFLLRGTVPSLEEIVTPDELAHEPMPIAHRAQADDIAFLQYTSGSTGDPKGVVLTHANLLANVRALGEAVQVGDADVFVSWLPLYHDMGLIGAWLGPLYFGFPLVLMSPLTFLARPGRWLQAIHRHRGTISAAPNFAYELCARKLPDSELAGLDLGCWRWAFNGAEPVSPATLEAFATRLAGCGLRREALAPVYGLAECSVGLAIPPCGRGPIIDVISRRGFAESREAVTVVAGGADAMQVVGCGWALSGHAMRVVDDSDRELPERRIGHLQFRGPSATQGYYRNTEATSRLRHGEWLDTGDYAYMAAGEVFLTGRAKDLIIRGGRNVYPYELEEAVGDIPGVRKGCVAVFGSADPANGTERLVVLAETREQDEAAREALRLRINEAATDVMGMPADEVVLAPPHTVLKTSSGKIRRAASRELFERGEIGTVAPAMWRQLVRLALPALHARAADVLRRGLAWLYGIYAWVVFLALAAPVWVMVAALQRPRLSHYLTHHAARLFLRLLFLPVSASGLDRLPAKAHVLVVNHASYLDAVILVALLPPRLGYVFAAKREFVGHWLPRLFFRGIGAMFVERFDARQGVEDVDAIIGALRQGESVVVFPEGTFSREAGLRPFRMGAFVASARADVPVVPAGLCGVRAVLRDRTWLPRRGAIRFEIGTVLAPAGDDWATAVHLRDGARAAILRHCGEPDLSPRP
jgi:acyl carrier protein